MAIIRWDTERRVHTRTHTFRARTLTLWHTRPDTWRPWPHCCDAAAADRGMAGCTVWHKLQELVYDILPSTTAVFSYAIGSRKLSANKQFFVGAHWNWVVSLLQTTQITRRVRHLSLSNRQQSLQWPAQIKPQPFESKRNSFLHPGWMRLMFTCVLWRYFSTVILVPETFGGRWPRRCGTAARR